VRLRCPPTLPIPSTTIATSSATAARASSSSRPRISRSGHRGGGAGAEVQTVIAIDPLPETPLPVPVRLWEEVLALGAAQPDDIAGRIAALKPDDTALHHLHLGHRRRAEGGDAQPPQRHRQLPRRLPLLEMLGLGRRSVSVVSAAVAFLRAHRRHDVPISIGAEIYFAEVPIHSPPI